MIKLSIEEKNNQQVLVFDIEGGVAEPAELAGLKLPNLNSKKGVIISGRGPVWLYGYLVHECHAHPFVATHDPRLGAIVVESHTKELKPGDVIQF